MTSRRREYPPWRRALQDEQESDTCLGACLLREEQEEEEAVEEVGLEAICKACWMAWTVREETVKENVYEAAAQNRAGELGCEKLLLGFDVK